MQPRTLIATTLLGLAVLATPPRVHAAPRWTIAYGVGIKTCESVLTGVTLRLDAIHWMAGYLSAVNELLPETYDITGESTGFAAWASQYCRLNPTHDFGTAVAAYVKAAYPTRLTTAPETVVPPLPTRPARPAQPTRPGEPNKGT